MVDYKTNLNESSQEKKEKKINSKVNLIFFKLFFLALISYLPLNI